MLKRRSSGHELGELVSTVRNTYVNPDSAVQFDFHQSDKSILDDFGFHQLNLRTNLMVLIELEYFQLIDVRHGDLVSQDIQRVENTHCLHSRQVSPFLDFDCLFPVVRRRSNNDVYVVTHRTE